MFFYYAELKIFCPRGVRRFRNTISRGRFYQTVPRQYHGLYPVSKKRIFDKQAVLGVTVSVNLEG